MQLLIRFRSWLYFLLFAVIASLPGCSPVEPSKSTSRIPSVGPTAGLPNDGTLSIVLTKATDDATPVKASTAWTFRSEEHGFSLELPSPEWKQNPKPESVAEFWRRMNIGSPMLFSVSKVKKETEEEFRACLPLLKGLLNGKDYLAKPEGREGETKSASRVISASAVEKGAGDSQFFYE